VRVVVVGLGNFGASAARALSHQGHQVVALDVDEAKVERLAATVERILVGNGTDPAVLEAVGAKAADAGLVSTGDDVTASVLTCLALRDCGVRKLFVKVISELHRRILDRLGVDETVFPEHDSAERLACRMGSAAIVNHVPLGPGFSAQELAVPDAWIGRSLRELELPRRFRVSVVAVHDYLSDTMTPIPDPDAPLRGSETLLVAGEDENLSRIARLAD